MFGRFRSAARDKKADIARVASIRAATRTALLGAESEAAGLKRRLEETRSSLGLTLGNEDGSFFEREEQEEKEIVLLEAQLLVAERRLRDLSQQIEKFAEINRLLDEISGERNAPA